jgi:Mrp family chromosome partitioning ATPase
MLQALKNLEARSARTPAPNGVAKKNDEPVAELEAAVSETDRRPLASECDLPVLTTSWPTEPSFVTPKIDKIGLVESRPAAQPVAAAIFETPAVSWRGDVSTQEFGFPVSLSLPGPEAPNKPPPREPGPTRPPCALEREIRRTLRDRTRALPLEEMAERLQRDILQNECKKLVFVGIGPASTTLETLLYASMLLADAGPKSVLLIDADPARQSLTTGLEYAKQSGLTELLANAERPARYCQLTATERLSFLPAGLARHTDLSTAGPRLEQLLEQLASDFSCLLIDGGRTTDLAATALARQTDAAYFVIQLGVVGTSEAQAALRDFRAAGARVLGCIAT